MIRTHANPGWLPLSAAEPFDGGGLVAGKQYGSFVAAVAPAVVTGSLGEGVSVIVKLDLRVEGQVGHAPFGLAGLQPSLSGRDECGDLRLVSGEGAGDLTQQLLTLVAELTVSQLAALLVEPVVDPPWGLGEGAGVLVDEAKDLVVPGKPQLVVPVGARRSPGPPVPGLELVGPLGCQGVVRDLAVALGLGSSAALALHSV